MCGIVGIASKNIITERGWLATGRDAMRHRGPDSAGEWWSPDGRVGLGHRRLAIIDLSSAGHQPMLDASGELCIVFNGEIYNFEDLRQELIAKGETFRSNSDTEVVLAAYREWGTDCLLHMDGMFAFALHDRREQQLFMARDRAGEKPLFYKTHNGEIRFASELKGLMADHAFQRRINLDALDCYLAFGYVQGDDCILAGVKKLPPAHALLFDLNSGQSQIWRYWKLPECDNSVLFNDADESVLLDELERLLEDSVQRQLVADVPVGVLLSGGVDSSLVTAMAVRAAKNIKTFTIRFPGYGKYDETEHARLIAHHFKTEHVELEAEPASLELLPVLARQFDEPMVDSSMIPTYLVSHLVRQHCAVALGGDGGDELFGGYSAYNRLLWMERWFGWIPRFARGPVANLAEFALPVGFKGRNWLQGLNTDFKNDVPFIASCHDQKSRLHLMSGQADWALVAEQFRTHRLPRAQELLQRATRMDFQNYLSEDILVKVDRTSMLNSLEVRAPFLDTRLIEFAFGKVPAYLKATDVTRKVLLKKLASKVLPPAFDQRRKQGFSIPLDSWLRSGPWYEYFRKVLLDDGQVLFNHQAIKDLLNGQQKGYANGERLFGLVMFELWRREYQIQI